jgi:hypothetical protein
VAAGVAIATAVDGGVGEDVLERADDPDGRVVAHHRAGAVHIEVAEVLEAHRRGLLGVAGEVRTPVAGTDHRQPHAGTFWTHYSVTPQRHSGVSLNERRCSRDGNIPPADRP